MFAVVTQFETRVFVEKMRVEPGVHLCWGLGSDVSFFAVSFFLSNIRVEHVLFFLSWIVDRWFSQFTDGIFSGYETLASAVWRQYCVMIHVSWYFELEVKYATCTIRQVLQAPNLTWIAQHTQNCLRAPRQKSPTFKDQGVHLYNNELYSW